MAPEHFSGSGACTYIISFCPDKNPVMGAGRDRCVPQEATLKFSSNACNKAGVFGVWFGILPVLPK